MRWEGEAEAEGATAGELLPASKPHDLHISLNQLLTPCETLGSAGFFFRPSKSWASSFIPR